ncbi:MAG: serine protein kinase [Desulfobacterales bacterium CG07_land_8_20_14_0_80_52_14]|nr:MAG: serine protein kinase [Desulfobacterales bacterium CG23_combo_of_CG06-09_8_20_14_all_52_9]PIU49865.1 MAG: serine protein kinase [Desulfobacterales bacterium CG07_land_8_20_14_0_80_52_14]
MEDVEKALKHLNTKLSDLEHRSPVSFEAFLEEVTERPRQAIRNIFQVFYDMVMTHVEEGVNEYPDDPEAAGYVHYDCRKLFVEGVDRPFFADRLFSYRWIRHVEAMRQGAQQNKIYIFDGPAGCGKSTFLNNLLKKFEEYTNTEAGIGYEILWRIDRGILGQSADMESNPLMERLSRLLERSNAETETGPDGLEAEPEEREWRGALAEDDAFEIPCPSHDNPILIIPKELRRSFLDDLFKNNEFKWKLSTEKEYEWVFKGKPCTICSTLYEALLEKLKSPMAVFELIRARPYRFNRRLGQGISVYNPGDKPIRQEVMGNPMLQKRINSLFKDSNQVKYLFSRYAKTNNGIYALMDIKSHNVERLIELHNIVSEGVHKVEDLEESVNSLFMVVMNPEDKKNITDIPSFSDRIEYIRIPYVMDLRTEVEIYRSIFGKQIGESFLPRVLHNFARAIIASRLNTRSDALLEWIGDPEPYRRYCDKNLHLLKIELYTGHIPDWLSEEHRKQLTAKRRRKILSEADKEGEKGFSGRDSIRLFNKFYSIHAKEGRLINMSMVCNFFVKILKEEPEAIPEGFLESLRDMYDYMILQEVKESLYYYNEEQISREIQNYLFALNFEIGAKERCTYTNDALEITEEFLSGIENRLLGGILEFQKRVAFRKDTQKEYTSNTLTQEIIVEGKPINQTGLYETLHERYVFNLKKKVLEPFLKNENFRRAVKEYGEESFKTYDRKIREDVTFMINNLIQRFRYADLGAKEICIYVIDNDLARKFSEE